MSETIRILIALSLPLGLAGCLQLGRLKSRRDFAVLAIAYMAAEGVYLVFRGANFGEWMLYLFLNAALIIVGVRFRKAPTDRGAGPNRRTL